MRDPNPVTIYLKDYTVPEYLIDNVELNFILDEKNTRVVSKLLMRKNPLSQSQNRQLVLRGEGLELINVSIDGTSLHTTEYQQSNEELSIINAPQDQPFILSIENTINPKTNTALEGLYLSSTMLCTQCEAEGFRKITYFLDRPDIMCTFKTTLVGDKDKYPVLLSNGNKVAEGELQNNRHWVTWEDPFKKPCYLFALVAGQLDCIEDTFTTMSGRNIALQIFVESHDIDKCDHAMQSLKKSMRWDEETYGREYDLDLYMIVAVGHFNMGAMENKGLNVFNTKFVLARPDTATDSDYEHIEGVIGHEYFHNWTGNRITCRDWFQLSLKEGFTVFRDQEFTGDQTSKAVKRIEDVKLLRTRQFAEDAGPLSHPIRPDSYIEINNFYTLTVYEKGAEVVRMIRTLVGNEGFRKGSDLYFQRHDGQAVTCDDFVNAMESANDADLEQFRHWYSQAGTPVLEATEEYNANNKTYSLTLKQSCSPSPGQPTKVPLHIPVKLGLLAKNGSIATLKLKDQKPCNEVIINLKEQQQTFVFEQLDEKPVISLLRGFSAPVVLKMKQSLEDLAFLLSHDPDTFNRWEAGQKMSGKIIFSLIKDKQQGREMELSPLLIDSFKQILQQPWDDLSYFSLLLSLPEENYLAGQMTVVDVEAIHQAREFVKLTLAQHLKEQFLDLYQRYHKDESGQFDTGAIGRRRIKNICLSYLNTLASQESYQLADNQFESAKNMTDQIAALSVIINSSNPAKPSALQKFYQQWKDEALVIDKWFTLQASSSADDTFSTVQSLMEHPAFELTNPNRVRSLIGAFSQANQLHFHAANGQGYQFLADQVIALNSINPQVASRMVAALTQWKRFDNNRQSLMKTALEKIINTPNISKDVYEVASKSIT
ncbi:MAG: aminopeptidase N [Methylococcales bacterium]|nr:aminopeptidase N [Methylococcales bacterium]